MNGWFRTVPAYRLATFRVAIALTTLLFHIPEVDKLIRAYLNSTFHMPPAVPWVPSLSLGGGALLMTLRHLAGWMLLLGWWPRISAGLLALSGAYVMLLDPPLHFQNNLYFHAILLALLACVNDRLSLSRLLHEDDGRATCPAWPERLILVQVAVVFFYAALDKVYSPDWGVSGARLAELKLVTHGAELAWLQALSREILQAVPNLLSPATIAVEFFLAAAVLYRPFWSLTTVIMIGFMAYLEFLFRPGLFPWDMMAVLFLLAPAGDRAYTVLYDAECSWCQWNRRWLTRLDWLRRLRLSPLQDRASLTLHPSLTPSAVREALHLIGPQGSVECGYRAFRKLLLLLSGPLYVLFVLVRFEVFGSRWLGLFHTYDAIFFLSAGLLLLWAPGVSRLIGQPFYAMSASARYRISNRFFGTACHSQACASHRSGRSSGE